MKLYYMPGVCSLSPHIVLREAGAVFEAIRVDRQDKTLPDGSDYRAVNPLGYVPALALDDGTVLTEGPAIVQHVAELTGRVGPTDLVPACGSVERAKLQSWLNFISTELHKGFSPLFNPAFGADAKAIVQARLMERLGHLDAHLAARDGIMGAHFTVADAYAFTVTGWARPLKLDIGAFKAIAAYRERIAARPAVIAAMKAEGLIK